MDQVARTCSLSEIEKKRLVLAGKGDIKRFFDRVEEKRKKFDKVKTDQNKIGEIYQELLPLQMALNAGLFGEDSFHAKMVKRVLSPEQMTRYQEVIRERNQFRYRAKVELAVAQLDQTIGFRESQRQALVEMIVSETKSPKRFGQYDYYLVLYMMRKIPQAKLKALFDEKQWAFLSRTLDQMRGMEQFLRQQGMLPAQDEAAQVAVEFVKALRAPPRAPGLSGGCL